MDNEDLSPNDQNSEINMDAPLKEHQIIREIDSLLVNQTYLVVYITTIDFSTEFNIGTSQDHQAVQDHDRQNLAKTFYKVMRGTTTANKLLLCPFSYCLKHL